MLISLFAILILAAPTFNQTPENVRAIFSGAITNFLAGRIEESTIGFDEVARLSPDDAPHPWQRGIALYYVGRYQDCREQFELHRTVNPADVENAVWHFICVARLESPQEARNALLPVGLDRRSPMPEVYAMFRGTMTPEEVLESATEDAASEFYAHLYLALYYEAFGDQDRALEHIRIAADDRFGPGYMPTVARIHLQVLEGQE
jgi:lipoprotein NlpI